MILGIISIVVFAWLLWRFWQETQLEKKKNREYQNIYSSLLSLNISHLHDAANIFALLKNKIQNDKSLYDFTKGASFHFRSIFEELKLGQQDLGKLANLSKLPATLELLYKKDVLDLKDILDSELFQIGSLDQNRLVICDESKKEHALIRGNFSLISKAFLNLIENSLRYTEKQVKIELSDKGNTWLIKISSYGKSIPEPIVNAINKGSSESSGHGLNSLMDIMDYHQAKLSIDTLANEGACIRLEFDKLTQTPIIPKMTPSPKSYNLVIIYITTGLLIFASLGILWFIKHQNDTNRFKREFQTNPNKYKFDSQTPKKISQDTVKGTSKKFKRLVLKPVPLNQAEIDNELDSLINQQDQALGLHLEL